MVGREDEGGNIKIFSVLCLVEVCNDLLVTVLLATILCNNIINMSAHIILHDSGVKPPGLGSISEY